MIEAACYRSLRAQFNTSRRDPETSALRRRGPGTDPCHGVAREYVHHHARDQDIEVPLIGPSGVVHRSSLLVGATNRSRHVVAGAALLATKDASMRLDDASCT